MNRWRRQRAVLITVFLLTGISSILIMLTCREVRQERLNRALIASIKREDAKEVERLLEQGSDANARDSSTEPLSFLKTILRLFSMHGVTATPSSFNAMQLAVSPNLVGPENWVSRFKIVEALAQHGASVNVEAPFGDAKAPPLYILYISLASHKVLHFFVDHGAKVDLRENEEWFTPLMSAVYDRDTQGAKILINAGADVNARTSDGTTPLSLTEHTRKDGSCIIDRKTRDLLLKAGAKK